MMDHLHTISTEHRMNINIKKTKTTNKDKQRRKSINKAYTSTARKIKQIKEFCYLERIVVQEAN